MLNHWALICLGNPWLDYLSQGLKWTQVVVLPRDYIFGDLPLYFDFTQADWMSH